MRTGPLTLRDVVAATDGRLLGSAAPNLALSQVCTDSRLVQPGALFVALQGRKHDGHNFVAEAFARGAAAALVERVPDHEIAAGDASGPPMVVVSSTADALAELARRRAERVRPEIVAVVGSHGRRTTADLIRAVLSQQSRVVEATAVQHPALEVPLALLRASHDASTLVLELSLGDVGNPIAVLDATHLSTLIVTSTQAPFDRNRGRSADPAAAIESVVSALPSTETVVLNGDDQRARDMVRLTTASPILFGLGDESDVRAMAITSHGLHGTEFELGIARRSTHVRMQLLGLYTLHGALAAAAVGVSRGMHLGEVAAGLQAASPTPRIIVATGVNGSRIIDDSYNSSPESSLEALTLLGGMHGRKIAVLGDMLSLGSFEEAGHRKIGNRAATTADLLVTVGPRAALIADEARLMGLNQGQVFEAANCEIAIDHLRRHLQPGDNVLIKGARQLGLEVIVAALRVEG